MKYFYLRISKVFVLMLMTVTLLQSNAWSQVEHKLFTQVLSDYVDKGKIDFTQMCNDTRLEQYTNTLSTINPQQIANEKDRFAFWLNTYNSYSLAAICKEYPINNINDLNFGGLIVSVLLKKSIWDQPFVIVNNQNYTLRTIDHDILRPTFKDSRILFAISCGAIGCAPSRSEAYEGSTLNQQLDDQARIFINDSRLNSFNIAKKKAELSMLFKWSMKEFGNNDEELLLYLSQYLPKNIKESITRNPSEWRIKYKKYDLDLNDAKN